MVHSRRRALAALGAVSAIALALAGCSGNGSGATGADGGKVTITVGDAPPASQGEAHTIFMSKVKDFEKANPGITVKTSETKYDPQTFAAQLAGKTVPDMITVPYTDIQALIARGQLKDLSAQYSADKQLKVLNPSLTEQLQADGKYYAVPTGAFTQALIINRAVFQQAGLDPDTTPLSTWEDVRAAAKTIADKTDAAGFGQLTTNNQGGWILAGEAATRGGRLESTDSKGKATATVDSRAVKESLQWLKDLRWKDNAAGDNFLLQFSDIGPQVATGKYGMIIGAANWYNQFTLTYGMKPADYGVRPLPQTEDGLGNLGGGSAAIVPANATDAEAAAAVKWTEYFYLDKFTDPEFAKADAKAAAENGAAVPGTGLPLVDQKQYDSYLEAIKDEINVPLENFEAYNEARSSADFRVVTEPPVAAQQVYGILDAVVQAVLTDQNADIDSLLEKAQQSAASAVAQAQP
jgi:ABC-type glycerol-3-phosphate transport system substrate-binding protein